MEVRAVSGVLAGTQELPDFVAGGVLGHSIDRDRMDNAVHLKRHLAALANRRFFWREDVELV